MLSASKTVETDESGRFEFAGLTPGTYSIATDGRLFGLEEMQHPKSYEKGRWYGRTVRGGLTVRPDEILDGVELKLARPGHIVGTVVDTNGLPVAAANVYVRDAHGELLHRVSQGITDIGGRFRYGRSAPGRYTVTARVRGTVSEASDVIEVREGEEATVKLVLKPGCSLCIAVIDKTQRPAQARVSVRDEHGWEFAHMLDTSAVNNFLEEGQASADTIIGPLASGTYRVTATTADGKSVTNPVTLTGEREFKLTLRLD